eukprot:TRINITY_DN17435_c0_g1_i3.p1 TRINITY_DN17435_c0_g1~~TRINITY_DN17435_c0_g1_i3.p1  ORF type:complete len:342 (+),score=19.95 TRINITY_DN17435_c0_g1_i3:93-1118(+)
MIRRPPRSTLSSSSAASDVYKRQQLYRANAELTPSPFPFYAELQYQYQQHQQQSVPTSISHVDMDLQPSPTTATNNSVVMRPLQFLPPPPPSMQTYFVAHHTFTSGTSYASKFPATELYTKPGTGDWSAGYGPEYAATVEDGLPASRELYDPSCEPFSKFYEVLMRWYSGVCRAQAIHSTSAIGNPLVSKLTPVPSIDDYTTDFVGWVRELNRWWDAEVKPKTGSLHVLLSARTTTTASPLVSKNKMFVDPTVQSVPRSLAPPPLQSSRTQILSSHPHAAVPSTTTPAHQQHSIITVTTVAVSSGNDYATQAATHRAKPNNFIQCNNNGNVAAATTKPRIW